MKKDEFEKYLEDYLDGSLEGERLREFERALAVDPVLREEAQAHWQLTDLLRKVSAPRAPASLRGNIMRELRAEQARGAAPEASLRGLAEESGQDRGRGRLNLWERLAAMLPQWRLQFAVATAFIAVIVVTFAVINNSKHLAVIDRVKGNNEKLAALNDQKKRNNDQPVNAKAIADAAPTAEPAARPSAASSVTPAEEPSTAAPLAPPKPGRLVDLGAKEQGTGNRKDGPRTEELKMADAGKMPAVPGTEAVRNSEGASGFGTVRDSGNAGANKATPFIEPQWPDETQPYQPGQMADAMLPGETQSQPRNTSPYQEQATRVPESNLPSEEVDPSEAYGDEGGDAALRSESMRRRVSPYSEKEQASQGALEENAGLKPAVRQEQNRREIGDGGGGGWQPAAREEQPERNQRGSRGDLEPAPQEMQRSFAPNERSLPQDQGQRRSEGSQEIVNGIGNLARSLFGQGAPSPSISEKGRGTIGPRSFAERNGRGEGSGREKRTGDAERAEAGKGIANRGDGREQGQVPASPAPSARVRGKSFEEMPEPRTFADAVPGEDRDFGESQTESARKNRAQDRETPGPSLPPLGFAKQAFQPSPFTYRNPQEDARTSDRAMPSNTPRSPQIVPAQRTRPKGAPVIINVLTNGLTVRQIQSFLEDQGVETHRARTQNGAGPAVDSLVCTARGKNLNWVLGRLGELGISHESALNNQPIHSARSNAEAAREFQENPARRGITFVSGGARSASRLSDDDTSGEKSDFIFHINVDSVRGE